MTAVDTARDTATATRPNAGARRRRRGIAVVVAALAAGAVQTVGGLAGADFVITDATGTAVINLPTALGFTAVVALLGWLVLAGLERLTRRGTTIWTVLATVVVAASLAPVLLVEATTTTRVWLVLIHLVVGLVLIPGFTRSSRG